MNHRNEEPRPRCRAGERGEDQAAKPDRADTATFCDIWQDRIDCPPDFIDRPHARRKESEVNRLLAILDNLLAADERGDR